MVCGNYWWGHKVILLIANSAVPRRPWSPCGCSSPSSLRAFARCLSCHGWPPWPSLVVFCYQMVIITVIVVMLDDMKSHWWYVNWCGNGDLHRQDTASRTAEKKWSRCTSSSFQTKTGITNTRKIIENLLESLLFLPMQFPAGISTVLLVWLSCRVSYINNNTISG